MTERAEVTDRFAQQDLRQMRRFMGLTQLQLAQRLGVKQASISRWESGSETIPKLRAAELADIFSNKHDDLHPVISRLTRRNPDVSVTSTDGQYLKLSRALWTAFGLDPDEATNTSVTDWIAHDGLRIDAKTSCRDLLQSADDMLCMECQGNIATHAKESPSVGIWVSGCFYSVRFDGFKRIILFRPDKILPGARRQSVLSKTVDFAHFAIGA